MQRNAYEMLKAVFEMQGEINDRLTRIERAITMGTKLEEDEEALYWEAIQEASMGNWSKLDRILRTKGRPAALKLAETRSSLPAAVCGSSRVYEDRQAHVKGAKAGNGRPA